MTIGDLTRSTFRPDRHYSGVRMQQGRVQLDADWNEQLDLTAHRDRVEAVDVIGAAGVPKVGGGFELTVSPRRHGPAALARAGLGRPATSARRTAAPPRSSTRRARRRRGRLLVLDGRELAPGSWVEVRPRLRLRGRGPAVAVDVRHHHPRHASVAALHRRPAPARAAALVRRAARPAAARPHRRATPPTRASSTCPSARYLAYLDVWERIVTALDDPTHQRAGPRDRHDDARPGWSGRSGCSTSRRPRAPTTAPPTSQQRGECARRRDGWPLGRCLRPAPPTCAGRRRRAGTSGWRTSSTGCTCTTCRPAGPSSCGAARTPRSRPRGSARSRPTSSQVASIGRDAVLGFRPGDWVELYDDRSVLDRPTGHPGPTARRPRGPTHPRPRHRRRARPRSPISRGHPQVRRWDSPGPVTVDRRRLARPGGRGPGQVRVGRHLPPSRLLAGPGTQRARRRRLAARLGGEPLAQPAAAIRHDIGAAGARHGAGVRARGHRLPRPVPVADRADRRRRDRGQRRLRHARAWRPCRTRSTPVPSQRPPPAQPPAARLRHRLRAAVHCGPTTPRRARLPIVTVEPGTAIDADGNDLDVADRSWSTWSRDRGARRAARRARRGRGRRGQPGAAGRRRQRRPGCRQSNRSSRQRRARLAPARHADQRHLRGLHRQASTLGRGRSSTPPPTRTRRA